ncbi:MAG TPA: DUF4233 domain-containing protein [Mycobacteriales bacterium]|jgi:hypothetical protein
MGEAQAPDAGPDAASADPGEDFAALEQARLRGAAKGLRGMFAGTLCLEAFTVILVPRTVAQFGTGLTTAKLTVLLVLAGLLVAAAFLQRRRWGTALGSVLQLGVVGCGVMTGAMFVLGGIFVLIWLYELRLRKDLLTPRSIPAP